jgi:hypothetical protein
MAVAIGQMGLSRDDYLDSTPFEFEAIHRLWIEKIEKDRENELVQKLMVARLMVFRTLCPPPGKTIKITDLWELPGEAAEIEQERKKVVANKENDRKRMEEKFGK